jgi:CDP-glucose 4,6-dehydratase
MRLFSHYRGKRVLVTGCTGFKGGWLSLWLDTLDAKVSGLALGLPTQPAMFDELGMGDFVDYRQGDVRDRGFVERVIAEVEPDVVFHLAAQSIVRTSYEDPVGTFATNVMGTAHVLDALRRSGRPVAAVIVTSDKCYENVEWVFGYRETDALGGKDPYSASKAGAEMAIRAWAHAYFSSPDSTVRVAAVRAGNVIGGGDWAGARIVPDAMRAWSAQQPVVIRSPNATRPWQHVLEPLSGYLLTGARLIDGSCPAGEAFNFGPSAEQTLSVRDLLRALATHWGFGAEGEYLRIEPAQFHEAGLLKLNCDKALALLKWRPVLDAAETARLTAAWYAHFYRSRGSGVLEFTRGQLAEYAALARARGAVWASP